MEQARRPAVRRPDDEATFRNGVEEATVLLVSNATWDDTYLDGLDPGDWVQSVSAGNDRISFDVLRIGGVAGTALDVFEEEPLPEGSPPWNLPNALVTPHVAVHSRWYADRVADRFLESYGRWRRGEPPDGTLFAGHRTP